MNACDSQNSDETNSLSKLKRKNAGYESSYFIVPIDFSDKQLIKDEKNLIGPNGNAVYTVPNVFESEQQSSLPLSLLYDNEGYSDGYLGLGAFRHNYSSSMDNVAAIALARLDPGVYTSPQGACVYGWNARKYDLYRAAFSTSTASYNTTLQLCEISVNGEIKIRLPVFKGKKEVLTAEQYNNKPYHMVTRGDGATYLFLRDSAGNYQVMTNSQVKLERVGDTWKFTDTNDQIDTYDLDGKLISTEKAGKITTLAYDSAGLLTTVTGPFGEQLTFTHSVLAAGTDPRIVSVADSVSGVSVRFQYMIDWRPNPFDRKTRLDSMYLKKGSEESLYLSFVWTVPGYTYFMYSATEHASGDPANNFVQFNYISTNPLSSDYYNVGKISTATGYQTYTYKPTNIKGVDSTGTVTMNMDFVFQNFMQSPVILDAPTLDQVATYDSAANLTSITITDTTTSAKPGVLQKAGGIASPGDMHMTMEYDEQNRVISSRATTADGETLFRYGYDGKWHRPNRILRDSEFTLLTYNDKGQIVKQSKTKLDVPPKNHREFESFTHDNLRQRAGGAVTQTTHEYDNKGLRISSTDADGNVTRFEYDDKGKRTATFLPDGTRRIKQTPDFPDAEGVRYKMGGRAATINGRFIDARASTSQVYFVGGACDTDGFLCFGGSKIVKNYELDWSRYDALSNYSPHNSVGTSFGICGTAAPYHRASTTTNYIGVGHSWGGDSLVEYSKCTSANDHFNLLVTVDPVGTGDWNDGSDYWIEVYIKPGPPWKWAPNVRWVRRGSGWFKFWTPIIEWNWINNWNGSDWIAWAGGKGWYSTYDAGNANPDTWLSLYGHHADFEPAINYMENDSRYAFGLRK